MPGWSGCSPLTHAIFIPLVVAVVIAAVAGPSVVVARPPPRAASARRRTRPARDRPRRGASRRTWSSPGSPARPRHQRPSEVWRRRRSRAGCKDIGVSDGKAQQANQDVSSGRQRQLPRADHRCRRRDQGALLACLLPRDDRPEPLLPAQGRSHDPLLDREAHGRPAGRRPHDHGAHAAVPARLLLRDDDRRATFSAVLVGGGVAGCSASRSRGRSRSSPSSAATSPTSGRGRRCLLGASRARRRGARGGWGHGRRSSCSRTARSSRSSSRSPTARLSGSTRSRSWSLTIAGGALFGTVGLILAAPVASAIVRISADLERARGETDAEARAGPGAGDTVPA